MTAAAYNTALEQKHAALMARNAELSQDLLRANRRVAELEAEDRDWKECALTLVKADAAHDKTHADLVRVADELRATRARVDKVTQYCDESGLHGIRDMLNG